MVIIQIAIVVIIMVGEVVVIAAAVVIIVIIVVILSPSHIIKAVPAVRVITVTIIVVKV